jgi:hypothetical protein
MNLSKPLDLDPTDRVDGGESLTGEGCFLARALLELIDSEPPMINDGAESADSVRTNMVTSKP